MPTRDAVDRLAEALGLTQVRTRPLLAAAGFLPRDVTSLLSNEPVIGEVLDLLQDEAVPSEYRESMRQVFASWLNRPGWRSSRKAAGSWTTSFSASRLNVANPARLIVSVGARVRLESADSNAPRSSTISPTQHRSPTRGRLMAAAARSCVLRRRATGCLLPAATTDRVGDRAGSRKIGAPLCLCYDAPPVVYVSRLPQPTESLVLEGPPWPSSPTCICTPSSRLLDGMGRIDEYVARAKETRGPSYGGDRSWRHVCRDGLVQGGDEGRSPSDRRDGGLSGRRQCHGQGAQVATTCSSSPRTTPDTAISCKLASTASLEGYYYRPRIDLEMLQEHREGIIATSACLGGPVANNFLHGQPDKARGLCRETGRDLWTGALLHRDPGSRHQGADRDQPRPDSRSRKSLGLPLVATNDVHYCNRGRRAGSGRPGLRPDQHHAERPEAAQVGVESALFQEPGRDGARLR